MASSEGKLSAKGRPKNISPIGPLVMSIKRGPISVTHMKGRGVNLTGYNWPGTCNRETGLVPGYRL
jgi:hypothetical protein